MSKLYFEEEVQRRTERSQRVRVVTMVLPGMFGLLIALWAIGTGEEFFYKKSILPREFFLTLAVAFLGMSGLMVVFTYLQTGFKSPTNSDQKGDSVGLGESEHVEVIDAGKTLRTEIQKLRDEVEHVRNLASTVDSTARADLVVQLKLLLTAEANASVLEDFKRQVATSYEQSARDKNLFERFDESIVRLSKELEALGRRGNVNLALGAITTIVGLALLGLSVYSEITTARDWWEFISHFAPRFTLVVMIELFAYFFLSLYKSSLQEIKYFQNEITNVESKQAALRAAVNFGDIAMVSDIVSKLASTERNHVLSKDQTTVELEKARLEKDSKGEFFKYITDYFPKIPK